MTVARVQRVLDDADVRCLRIQFQISPRSRDFHRTFLLFGAIRGDRAAIEFRGYSPSAVEQLKQELGDKITVQQPDWNCGSFVEIRLGDRQLEQDRPSGIVTVMPVLASGMGYAAI